jgi:hypothetical protein
MAFFAAGEAFLTVRFLEVSFLTGMIASLVDVVRRYFNSTFASRPSMPVFWLPWTIFLCMRSPFYEPIMLSKSLTIRREILEY